MAKIIITEQQLVELRKSFINEDIAYGNLNPGQYRDCQGVGNIERCLTTSGNLKYNIKGDKPYFALIYKVTSGDTMSGILSKLNKEGNFIIENPMQYNSLLKSESEIRPNDVLLFDFEA